MEETTKRPEDEVVDTYQEVVMALHPDLVTGWPVISGYNSKIASTHDGWIVVILQHTGQKGIRSSIGLRELPEAVVGGPIADLNDKIRARARIRKHFGLCASDGVILVRPDGVIESEEFNIMLHDHERVMGLTPMKVFLCHKSANKETVRSFKRILEELGFEVWLDDEAMPAGTVLERGILRGFKESCAAVFFITPDFNDDGYLSAEINYAIAEKRARADRFAIIALVLERQGKKGNAPDLLQPFVWKEPTTDLEALWEVLRALPIKVGPVVWRQT